VGWATVAHVGALADGVEEEICGGGLSGVVLVILEGELSTVSGCDGVMVKDVCFCIISLDQAL